METPGDQATATAWPASQAVAAAIGIASLPGAGAASRAALRLAIGRLGPYWDGTAYAAVPGATARFYDDNDWIGHDLVVAADILGDWSLLERAKQVFAFVQSGWDSSGKGPCPGGVLWTTLPGRLDRNTVSTANAAVLGLELYLRTGGPGYLDSARRLYGWVRRCLGGSDGLYADRFQSDGTVEGTRWTYNQGAMIAAGVLLYRATHYRGYLRQAETLAARALAELAARAGSEPPEFVAILLRDLAVLQAERPRPEYQEAVRAYAALLAARRNGSGLIRRADRSATRLLEQAALVQVEAQLASTQP